ncbi:HAD-IIA family hydrolase [Pontiella agarivorans]|uniref:HAD-IIA family hydrolase n=1 Tax=Pontiella agarivorans TaxID=3038953 RepID=A0ABU5MVR3_9BACT|nr:HAD-IIA family hydrolase [Pontiella agarivorans]MDZ8118326.1 HAD-IIA family hydrolase [Pontiella agarivorans]
MEILRNKKAFICDMDGVIYHGKNLLPGVAEFVNWLKTEHKKFLFLTNNSALTLRELSEKLGRMGLDVDESHFYSSARATAAFLASQKPNGTAYVIGDAGIINALYDEGYSINDTNPDYVVVSEGDNYDYARICKATRLVNEGAKLIGTNPDLTGPVEGGVLIPSTGALLAPIELATGSKAYYVGKPNPLMMRNALKKLGCQREETVIVGDRMDTDMIAGIEAEIATCLVLSGVSSRENVKQFAYGPDYILNGVGDIVPS